MEIFDRSIPQKIIDEVAISRHFRGVLEDENLCDIVVREHYMQVHLHDAQAALPDSKYVLRASPEALAALVLGNLICEGIVATADDIERIDIDETGKTANVKLKIGGEHPNFLYKKTGYKPSFEDIFAQSEHLMNNCDLFYQTGALHSASLWIDGAPAYLFSDIGRHNAIDKVVGTAIIEGRDLSHSVLYSSGRMPCDMVEKALRAGVSVFASRSAPTAQSVKLAKKHGLTLVGFVGKSRMNIYTNDL